MDLKSRFDPLMSESLHYADTPEGIAMPLEEIHDHIIELVEKERNTGNNKIPSLFSEDITSSTAEYLNKARFAVYSWIDEKMLNSERSDASNWLPMSLQSTYYNTTNAGQRFFIELDALLEKIGIPKEEGGINLDLAQRLSKVNKDLTNTEILDVLRIYALCLLYGFKGRLFDQNDLLSRVRKVCYNLLYEQLPEIVIQSDDSQKKSNDTYKNGIEIFLFIVIPILVCIAFGFYCADILANIPINEIRQ